MPLQSSISRSEITMKEPLFKLDKNSVILFCVASILIKCGVCDLNESTFARLVVEADVDHVAGSGAYPTSGATGEELRALQSCRTGGVCSRLSECASMAGIVASACLQGDSSLFCGNLGNEPMVCCPDDRYPQESRPYPFIPTSTEQNSADDCGKTMVFGPQYQGLGAYPFVARIGFKNTNTGSTFYPCTGSIISRRIILTAAHCALAKADGHRLSSVRIGEWDSMTDPDCGNSFCARPSLSHAVSHVVVHPGYVKGEYSHDVAMLVLKTPLNYSVTVQSVCLSSDTQDNFENSRALLVGWGKMALPTAQPSQQQHLSVPVLATERCNRLYSGHVTLPPKGSWLCAGGEPGGDACQGFGGAPLVIREGGRYVQVGIMSFGSDKCGASGMASVYTKVAHYAQWIRDNAPA